MNVAGQGGAAHLGYGVDHYLSIYISIYGGYIYIYAHLGYGVVAFGAGLLRRRGRVAVPLRRRGTCGFNLHFAAVMIWVMNPYIYTSIYRYIDVSKSVHDTTYCAAAAARYVRGSLDLYHDPVIVWISPMAKR
jgi:hypothetical protein